MPYVMVFGKYKGESVTAIPDGAIDYYLKWDQLRPDTKLALEAEKARRAAGGRREALKVPDPDSPPSRPRPRQPSATQDPTGGWTQRRQLCAVDLIAWGAAGLLKERPESRPIIEEAADWLRTLAIHGVLAQNTGPVVPAEDEAPF